MPPASNRHALVAGAGIGGLAAALALRQSGWQVTVLERAGAARELGFALLMAPNAMRALRALGVADAVAARGTISAAGELRRPDGRVLRRMDTTRLREALGEDTVCVLRPALHGALLEALGPEALRLDAQVTSYAVTDGEVVVTTSAGAQHRGQILVGADGLRSAVRGQLLGDAPLRYAGFVGWRGVAQGVDHLLGGLSGVQYLGRGVEAGMALAAPGSVYWFLALPCPAGALDPSDPRAGLDGALTSFHDAFRAVVAATGPDALRRDEIYDRDPATKWGEGPITLLGDAAHPMPPNAGQGAAQALEDAVVLGRCLAHATAPSRRLRRDERARMPRSAAIVELARGNARMFMIRSAPIVFARDLAIRFAPERALLGRLILAARSELEPPPV